MFEATTMSSTPSFTDIYLKNTDWKAKSLLIIGFLCCILEGAIYPISMIFFGSFINIMNIKTTSIDSLLPLFYLWFGSIIILGFISFIQSYFLALYAEKRIVYFRQNYIESLLRQDVSFLESINPNKLGEVLNEQSSKIREGLGPSLGSLFKGIFQLIGGFIVGFIYSWKLTLTCFITIPILILGTYLKVGTDVKLEDMMTKDSRKANSIVEETTRNIRTVTAFTSEEYFTKQFAEVTSHTRDGYTKMNSRGGLGFGLYQGSTMITYAITFVSAVLFAYYERQQFPQQLIDNHCITSSVEYSVDICFNNHNLTSTCQAICNQVNYCFYESSSGCLVGGDTIIIMFAVIMTFINLGFSLNAIPLSIQTKEAASVFLNIINKEPIIDSDSTEGVIPQNNNGIIHFNKVSYKYHKENDQYILHNLSLDFPTGKTIGIVGPSGSGKSTLIKLLLRFYDPNEGSITYDNINLKELNIHWLRNQMGYVAQEPVLFSGTIKDNLLLGKSEGKATDEEIIEACKRAGADEFIQKFPKKYDTFVGELGSSISGGQKQRIAIARALLRKPKILIFDEATSALDSKSEEQIQEAIESIRKEKDICIIIIAHRLSSIQNSDIIYVIKDGELEEEGNHQELLGNHQLYYELWKNIDIEKRTKNETKFNMNSLDSIHLEKKSSTKTSMSSLHESDNFEYDDIENGFIKHDYSFKRLFNYMIPYKYMFYLCFVLIFMKCFNWPLFSYYITKLEALLYSENLSLMIQSGILDAVCIFIVGFIMIFVNWSHWYIHGFSGEHLVYNIKMDAFKSICHQPPQYFDSKKHNSSIITTKVSVDSRRVRDGIVNYVNAITEMIFCITISLIFILCTNWIFGLITLIFTPIIAIVESFGFIYIVGLTFQIDTILQTNAATLSDYLFNIYTVYSFNMNTILSKKIINELKHSADFIGRKRALKNGIGSLVSTVAGNIYFPIVFILGAILSVNGYVSSEAVFFITLCGYYCASNVGIGIAYVPQLQLATKSVHDLFDLIDTPSLLDSRNIEGDSISDIKGHIEFHNVSFKYPSRPDVQVLKRMNIDIPSGSNIAFVGESGCGKSTIISLLERMYNPESGYITLDGKNIKDWNLHYLRTHMGIVFQEPILFAGDIYSNIALGMEGKGPVTENDIYDIARLTLCDTFIEKLPDQYHTSVGETGKLVSGGEKQRIALARALIRQPSILILDEATSALDNESQNKFMNALENWRQDHLCTVINVAHRISTIQNCDIIFFIKNGSVYASGNHNELIEKCPEYKEMVLSQSVHE